MGVLGQSSVEPWTETQSEQWDMMVGEDTNGICVGYWSSAIFEFTQIEMESFVFVHVCPCVTFGYIVRRLDLVSGIKASVVHGAFVLATFVCFVLMWSAQYKYIRNRAALFDLAANKDSSLDEIVLKSVALVESTSWATQVFTCAVVGSVTWCIAAGMLWYLRSSIRWLFRIPGNVFEDVCLSLFCGCCVLAQLARHTSAYKEGIRPNDTLKGYILIFHYSSSASMVLTRIAQRHLVASLLLFSMIHPSQGLVGICYDNYHVEAIDSHFQTIKQRFGAVRTFQTLNKGVNAVDAAAKAGLKIAAGVWIRASSYKADLDAAIDGARRHPDTVHVIFIGNEDLLGNTESIDFVISKVGEAKSKLNQAGLVDTIKIGSVQTDGDWLRAPQLAALCDILGVNIYPFFGGSSVSASNPIQDLDARWNAIKQRYGDKVLLTETGWPHDGGNHGAHISNQVNARAYFQAFNHWVQQGNGGSIPYYFMFHDNPSKPGFERYFGLADTSAHWKYDFPSLSDNTQTPPPRKCQLRSSDGQYVYQHNGAVLLHKIPTKPTPEDIWFYFSDTNTIVNQGNQQCLDLASGQHLQTYMCTPNNSNQQWSLQDDHLSQTSYNVCMASNQGTIAVAQCLPDTPNLKFKCE